MGSAGFIVESAKYIKEHYKSELTKTVNREHYRNGMFFGYDTDATMLRIGAMNLMLHEIEFESRIRTLINSVLTPPNVY